MKPPEPTSDPAADTDRVTVDIKVTDKMGDAFVSTNVGYSSSMTPEDGGDPMKLYRRVARTVNSMYAERRAEVRRALGSNK